MLSKSKTATLKILSPYKKKVKIFYEIKIILLFSLKMYYLTFETKYFPDIFNNTHLHSLNLNHFIVILDNLISKLYIFLYNIIH